MRYVALFTTMSSRTLLSDVVVLILVLFCRYWNGLLVKVKTSALVPLLQFLGNIDFC